MPGYTTQITVSNITASLVTANTYCSRITVAEDPSVANWPTQEFTVVKGESTNPSRSIPTGGTYTFVTSGNAPFRPGDVVGYIQAASGTTTFFQDENMP